MASKLVGIVGATGTGKSTAIKHLNPEETYIINDDAFQTNNILQYNKSTYPRISMSN